MKHATYLLLFAFIAPVLLNSAAWALDTTATTNAADVETKARTEYQQHVNNFKQGMAMQAHVKAAREAFAKSNLYEPYHGPEVNLQGKLRESFETENWQQCLEVAEAVLSYSYVSLIGHFAAAACNGQLGNTDVEQFHGLLADQIIDVIIDDNDGRSAATAFKTLSTPELYLFLNLMGLTAVEQSLLTTDDGPFDVMMVHGSGIPEDAPIALYFDISPQFARGFDKRDTTN